jgi:hemolysin activation/secretion protein
MSTGRSAIFRSGLKAGRGAATAHPRLLCALVLAGLITGAGGAAAQTAKVENEPAQVEERLRVPEPAPSTIDPVEVPRAGPAASEAAPVDRFVLTAVIAEGATVYSDEELAELYIDYLARPVDATDIERILAAFSGRYRDDGYFLSSAVAPPQSLEGGRLTIRIHEGYVGQVTLEGDLPASEASLDGLLAPVMAERPLRLVTLERYVLLLNDRPGVRVKPRMKPVEDEPGAYELVLEFNHDPISIFAGLDNRGTREVGRLQGFVAVDADSNAGWLEHLRVLFFTVPDDPEELLFGKLSYDQPFGPEGTTLGLDLSFTDVDASAGLASRDVEGQSLRAGFEVMHPLVRTRANTLRTTFRFDLSNIEQDADGGGLFDDRLRVLRLGLSWSGTDAIGGATTVAFRGSQGIDFLNASDAGADDLSRLGGVVEFSKLTIDVTRRQDLWSGLYARILASGQYSEDTLLSSEEFRLGGARLGRAFDSSELSSSNGIGGALELGYRDSLAIRFLSAYEVYGFYDGGVVWTDSGSGLSLVSAGGGFSITLFRSVQAGFEVGVPLTRPSSTSGDNDPRYFFKLRARF